MLFSQIVLSEPNQKKKNVRMACLHFIVAGLALKSRICNPAKYRLTTIAKLSTREIKFP